MTREFDKQQRDGSRPPFRNAPSNRYGEERTPRPARPRLNRETVDRAWENGAPHVHADYHPRGNNAPGNNWRRNQNTPHSSNDRPGGNRAYGNQYEQPRYPAQGGQRPFNGNPNQGPRSRSFDSQGQRPYSGEQRFDNRRSYNDEPYRSGRRQGNENRPYSQGHPSFNQRTQAYDRGTNSRDQGRNAYDRPYGQERGPQFREQERPRRFQGPGQRSEQERVRRGAGRNAPPERSFDRDQGPRRGGFKGRSARDEERPYRPPHPRAQTRSWTRPEPPEETLEQNFGERFEGDYERFGTDDMPRPTGRAPRGPRHYGNDDPQPERHVTRLPDGRVLKGPRPVQRKNAQFWTEVAEDTDELLQRVHTPEETEPPLTSAALPTEDAEDASETTDEVQNEPDGTTQPARRAASAARRKKAGPGRTNTLKPSQRGYKWPAP